MPITPRSFHPMPGRTRAPRVANPPVCWTPTALNARLQAERALRSLPRRTWGISAEGRSELARIVVEVDQGRLGQDAATDALRELTLRLGAHRQAQEAVQRSRTRAPFEPRHRFGH
jgi:hypothetical protein